MRKSLRFLGIIISLMMLVSYIPQFQILVGNISSHATNNDSSSQTKNDDSSEDSDSDSSSKTDDKDEEAFIPNFSFPDQMRGVRVTPGMDFFKNVTQSSDITQKEVNAIISTMTEVGMNSIIIDTDYNKKAYYTANPDSSAEEQAVKMLIDAAKKNYFYVYMNFDINFVLNEYSALELQDKIDYLTHIAHKFSRDYLADGIILEGYYGSKSVSNFNYYMNNGSGIGFENWLLENGAYVFSLVSKSIHKTDNTIPVGINISNMWANSSSNKDGSATKDTFQAYTDGYADTVSYLNRKYADFIYLDTKGSLTDKNIPFQTVVNWWSQKATACNVPMYVAHSNDKIGTTATGWSLDDQVVKQLTSIEKVSKYSGSAMSSYSALVSKKSSTNALKKFYANTLDKNALLNELKMNSPRQTTFTTYEPQVVFEGSFDKNFDVTLNGEKIPLNNQGNFFLIKPLNVGLNIFRIENKGKVVTYKITRRIKVFQSINPKGSMRVDGKMTIDVSAVAYKGSTVTAKFNGKAITLNQTDSSWEGGDPNSSYALFTGKFTAPAAGKSDVKLGNIIFKANYKGANYEQLTGANVTLNKLPENVQAGKLIRINSSVGAKVFYDTSTYGYPIPRTRLPANTYDYYLKTVQYNGKTYYITQSGRRVLASDATLMDGNTFGENKVTFLNSSVQNYDTVMQFKLNKNSPIEVSSNPCNYYTSTRGNFYIDNYSATTIKITFDYVVGNTNNVSLPANSLFSSASWSTATSSSGKPQTILMLHLKKTGGYSGVAPSYSTDGTLTLRFNGHPSSLSGAIIALDPGHGYTEGGNDPGAGRTFGSTVVIERDINLAVAKLVESKLKAQGATVIRLKTESTTYPTESRSDVVRAYKPDIFISIHCNAASPDAKGTEAFYFYPYSQPLAKYLSVNVASSLGTNNREDQYNEFWVTTQQEFPSSLVELGFISNYSEAMKLVNVDYQDRIADSIVKSMSQYLANN